MMENFLMVVYLEKCLMVYNRIIKIFNFQFSFFLFITQVRHYSLISRFLMHIRMLIERFCTVFLCCFKQAHNNSFFSFQSPLNNSVFVWRKKISKRNNSHICNERISFFSKFFSNNSDTFYPRFSSIYQFKELCHFFFRFLFLPYYYFIL